MKREYVDRSKWRTWIIYMLANPLYFEMVCGVPFSKENVHREAKALFRYGK
jgi:hypothetical protein